MNAQFPQVENLLDAYRIEPQTRERLNDKGLYISFAEATTTVTYYLTEDIKDSVEYRDFVEVAMALGRNDTINLLIDSPGGYLSGANMIITALNSTEASSVAIVTDMAASAATFIALACDDLVMTENSYFMVHSVSYGSGGKLHEVAAHTEFTLKKSKELIAKVYEDFLTPEEIAQVIAGADFYFDAEETMVRWGAVQDKRAEKVKEAEAEHLKEHIAYLEQQLSHLKDHLPKPVKTKTPKPAKPKP